MSKKHYLVVAVGLLAIAVACSDKSTSPAAPSSAPAAVDDAGAAADGSTLKVPPPTQTAPANGVAHRAVRDDAEGQRRHRLVRATRPSSPTGSSCWSTDTVVRDFRTSSCTEWKRHRPRRQRHLRLAVPRGAGPVLRPLVGDLDVQDAGHPGGLHRRRRGLRPAVDRQDGGQHQRLGRSSSQSTGAKMVGHTSNIEYVLGADRRRWRVLDDGHQRADQHRGRQDEDHGDARGADRTSRPTTGASRSKSAATLPGPSPGA